MTRDMALIDPWWYVCGVRARRNDRAVRGGSLTERTSAVNRPGMVHVQAYASPQVTASARNVTKRTYQCQLPPRAAQLH